MPKQKTETRVQYVFNNHPYLPGSALNVYTFDDGWFPATPDGAASYPWLMNNCIVWVEERIVYEPEPWEVV
jgi:hypothetical protein